MVILIVFAAIVFIVACLEGIRVDMLNSTERYRSALGIILYMLVFSLIIAGIASNSGIDEGFIKGYKHGQVDYQKGKIEYKIQIKQSPDTIILNTSNQILN